MTEQLLTGLLGFASGAVVLEVVKRILPNRDDSARRADEFQGIIFKRAESTLDARLAENEKLRAELEEAWEEVAKLRVRNAELEGLQATCRAIDELPQLTEDEVRLLRALLSSKRSPFPEG